MKATPSLQIVPSMLAVLGLFLASPSPASPSPFHGHWLGTDAGDLSDIRLAIGGRPSGPFNITWTESFFSGCDGEAGIVRGTGSLSGDDLNVLAADLHLECFTTEFATDFTIEWRYDPASDTISSGDITWHRQGVRGKECLVPPAGLTGWWPGDGSATDIVAGRDGILHGDPIHGGSGLVNLAISLDGVDDFVEVPDDPALDFGTGDFSVDLWVLFKDTNGEQILAEKWVQADPGNLSIGWTLTKLEDNSLFLAMGDGSGTDWAVGNGPLPLLTNLWYHIAATRGENVVRLYLNGEELDASESPVLNLDSESSLKFGHRGGIEDTPGAAYEGGFYLNGRIDEAEIFVGTALSEEWIRDIYDAGTSGKCKD